MKFATAVKMRSTARSPLELLKRMRKLYDDPKAWAKGSWLKSDAMYGYDFDLAKVDKKCIDKNRHSFDDDEMRGVLNEGFIPPTANVAFCLDGACAFVNGRYEEDARRYLKLAIAVHDPIYLSINWERLRLDDPSDSEFIHSWNDARNRTIKDVRAVLDIAIEIAKKFRNNK